MNKMIIAAPTEHNYDMVYTSNARGQAEKTLFIDADDSTTRTSTRYYTWRDRIRKIVNPDSNALEYEWDDHLRMSKEKLQGNDEYYEYDWCICGPVKRHRYHYKDSLNNAQDMDWTNTTDNAGRLLKEYYPYTIAKHGSDEYHSVLYEHDRANRREKMSDPVWGHTCADTSGWGSHIEPSDETNWTFDTPTHYRYGMQGNVEAMGRVAGGGIVAGQGEPYFVQRDNLGRATGVTYSDLTSTGFPEAAVYNDFNGDGSLKQTAFVSTKTASSATYGPEKYVVQFEYDAARRTVRKVVRDTTASDATRFEENYEFDGMGRVTREKVLAWDSTSERMVVRQDIRTTYDLGGNATQVKF